MWTEKQRHRQAEIIQTTRIWEHSTGPRTEAGKKTSSQNALKHGLRGGILRKASTLISRNNRLLKELT
jgi:hypothetical protein